MPPVGRKFPMCTATPPPPYRVCVYTSAGCRSMCGCLSEQVRDAVRDLMIGCENELFRKRKWGRDVTDDLFR